MRRPLPSGMSYSFGPGALTPAVRVLLYTNVAVFLLTWIIGRPIIDAFGLTPRLTIERFFVWQPLTSLFVHAGFGHILFNMLILWMVGVPLERRWGTQAFTRYYFVSGLGASACVILASLLPFDVARLTYLIPTVGASGALYGLLIAWAILFPEAQVLMFFIFPVPARVAVAILGAIAFLTAGSGTGVSNFAHLGGLLCGYLYLKGPRNLRLELQYRLTKWRMARMRRRFDVHRGGRGGPGRGPGGPWVH